MDSLEKDPSLSYSMISLLLQIYHPEQMRQQLYGVSEYRSPMATPKSLLKMFPMTTPTTTPLGDRFDIEKLMEQYVRHLMEYPGMHVKVRISMTVSEPPFNTGPKHPDHIVEEVRRKVVDRTIEMLTMMGIEFERSPLSTNSLMIIDKLH